MIFVKDSCCLQAWLPKATKNTERMGLGKVYIIQGSRKPLQLHPHILLSFPFSFAFLSTLSFSGINQNCIFHVKELLFLYHNYILDDPTSKTSKSFEFKHLYSLISFPLLKAISSYTSHHNLSLFKIMYLWNNI